MGVNVEKATASADNKHKRNNQDCDSHTVLDYKECERGLSNKIPLGSSFHKGDDASSRLSCISLCEQGGGRDLMSPSPVPFPSAFRHWEGVFLFRGLVSPRLRTRSRQTSPSEPPFYPTSVRGKRRSNKSSLSPPLTRGDNKAGEKAVIFLKDPSLSLYPSTLKLRRASKGDGGKYREENNSYPLIILRHKWIPAYAGMTRRGGGLLFVFFFCYNYVHIYVQR